MNSPNTINSSTLLGFSKLRACPYCQGTSYSFQTISGRWIVACTSLECIEKPFFAFDHTRAEIEKKWNNYAKAREKELMYEEL